MRKGRFYSAYTGATADCKFDKIMTEDVKVLIAEAFLSLESNMRAGKPDKGLSEYEIFLVEGKAIRMKQEINDFIDSQKQRIISASEERGRNPLTKQ